MEYEIKYINIYLYINKLRNIELILWSKHNLRKNYLKNAHTWFKL